MPQINHMININEYMNRFIIYYEPSDDQKELKSEMEDDKLFTSLLNNV